MEESQKMGIDEGIQKGGIKILLFYVIYMNINLNKSNLNSQLFPSFQDQASPYLSPLQGLNTPGSSFYEDDFLNFALEEESQKNDHPINIEPEKPIKVQADEDGSSSPIIRLSEQEKGEMKELQTPSFPASPPRSKVELIIRFLVDNDKLNEQELKARGKGLFEGSEALEHVFQTLMKKFKKLKKTKEEMTKFCMRKAFKYANDSRKASKKKGLLPKPQKDFEQQDLIFQIPFKKNSSEKTMNNQFLKQIFSRKEFIVEYDKFLNELNELIEEDNDNKISYLANLIDGLVSGEQLQKIQGIKRLPWTKSILKKTYDLAFHMMEFAEEGSPEEAKKQR